jgi:cysteine desulfurase/selenocysteine lyase
MLEEIRRLFPALSQSIGEHRLAYLDSAASALKPIHVHRAVRWMYEHEGANIHRGVHTLSTRATGEFEAARESIAERFGVEPDQAVITGGTTAGLNLVAWGWAEPRLGPGDRIVVTELEHHSNLVPWQRVAARTGAEIVAAPITEDLELDLEAMRALIDERTRVVAVTHVSSVLGSVVDVAAVAAMAREVGAICVVDGAQAVAHRPVDVAALGCDFYAFSGHKVYGPTGVGVLIGTRERLAETEPLHTGGGMIEEVEIERSTFRPPPARFEAGTPPIAELVGLGAAFAFLGTHLADLGARESALVAAARDRLSAIDGLTVYAAPSSQSIVSFTLDGVHPHDLATVADTHGVAIRSGHHCAQPLMRRLGVEATARASFAVYNSAGEVDRLVAAVVDAKAIFR